MKLEPLTKQTKSIIWFKKGEIFIISEEQLNKIHTFTDLVINDET